MGDFVSGAYSATYNAKALGQTEQGYILSHEFFKKLIKGDLMGQSTQDAIYQGRDQFIEFELIEAAAAGVNELIEPYADSPGTALTIGKVGQRDVGNSACPGAAKPLILTRIPGLCAELSGPETITLPRVIIAENYPIRILHAADLRQIPIRLRAYPDTSGVIGVAT